MDIVMGLKQVVGELSVMADRVGMFNGKLEDLLFRAQRISAAAKNNLANKDTGYGYDLLSFRRSLRTFTMESAGLLTLLRSLERQAVHDEEALKPAQSMMRLTSSIAPSLKALHDLALLAHQHIRTADHKMEAWYIAQEIEEIAQNGQSLPSIANNIVIAVSTPPAVG